MRLRALATAVFRHGPAIGPLSAVAVAALLLPGAASSAAQDVPTTGPRAELPLSAVCGDRAAAIRPVLTPAEWPSEAVEAWAAAQAAADAGRADEALKSLNAALAYGVNADALLLLAEVLTWEGRLGEARSAAEHALLYAPDSIDGRVKLGQILSKAGQSQAALIQLCALATLPQTADPRVTAAWALLGDALEEAGYLRAASEAYGVFDRLIWEERPEHRATPVVADRLKAAPRGMAERRIDLLAKLGDFAGRVTVGEALVRARPDDLEAARLYVRTLVDAGRAAEALRFCRERLGADSATPLVRLAVEAALATDAADAWARELAEGIRSGANRVPAERIATVLLEAGAPAAAAEVWAALAATRPDDADTAWALAAAQHRAGRAGTALDTLIDFVRRHPDAPDLPPVPQALWTDGASAADDFLRQVAERTAGPGCDYATYAVLGAAAAGAELVELAESLLQSAGAARPDAVWPRLVRGRLLLAQYRWSEAGAQADEVLRVQPGVPAALRLKAEALSGLDELAAADAAYKTAVQASPRDAELLLSAGRHYRRVGNLLAAQRYLQEAWSAARRGEALEELVEVYVEGGKLEVARATLAEGESADVSADSLRRARTLLRFATAPLRTEHLAELQRQYQADPTDVRTALTLAAGWYLERRYDEAAALLEPLRAAAPRNDRVLQLYAHVQFRRLEYGTARSVLEELLRRHPRRASVLKLLADVELAEFRVEEARAALERVLALELAPDERDEYRGRLLSTYVTFTEYDPALDRIEEWRGAGDAAAADRWGTAKLQVLVVAERTGAALAWARDWVDELDAPYRRALAAYRALAEEIADAPDDRQREEAQRLERELSELQPRVFARRAAFVQAHLQLGEFAPAETALREWLAAEPDQSAGQSQVQDWLIETLLAARKPEEAARVMLAYRASPNDVLKVFGWRARVAVLTGRAGEAVRELESLLEERFIRDNAAARAQVRRELVTLLVEAQRSEDALARVAAWRDGARDPAERVEVLRLQRGLLLELEREDEALAVGEELLARQPQDPGLANDVGYGWIDADRRAEEAFTLIRRAVAAEPLNPAFLDSLGWAYYKQGDFAAAHEWLSRAVRIRGGKDAAVLDHLGDAAWRLGDARAARAHWAAAAERASVPAGARGSARLVALAATLRAKLTALDEGAPPPVARTLAEAGREDER